MPKRHHNDAGAKLNKGWEKFYGEGSSELAKDTYIYQETFNDDSLIEKFQMGPYNIRGLLEDPKRFGFLISRHKFVSKMLDGCQSVLEIGCQEGLGTLCVSKTVKQITAIDFYKPHIEAAQKGMQPVIPNATFQGHDMIQGPFEGTFDGAFALDVFEHIDPTQADRFISNIVSSLSEHATLILGIPSLESQQYASKAAAAGHINCMSGLPFKAFCQKYFHTVFLFGMNDEVLHTGFAPMCQYLFAVCVGPKR